MEQINWKTNISITNDKIKQSLANYLLSKKFEVNESTYLYQIDSQYFADFSYTISITIQDIENSYSDIVINFSYGETLNKFSYGETLNKFYYDEIIICGQYLYNNINRIDNIIIDKIGKVLDCIDILESQCKNIALLHNLDSNIDKHKPKPLWKIKGSNGKEYTDLQLAIDEIYLSGGGEIWIAKGIYKHGSSLKMRNNVSIYGGFIGNETSKSNRLDENETIIDGENKYRVFNNFVNPRVNDEPITSITKLDKVTIQNGYDDSPNGGGGIFNYNASPEITNCNFYNNVSEKSGGAISNINSSPEITNCNFYNNQSINGGAIANSSSSSTTISNCTFNNNIASNNGSGIYAADSSTPILNCTFNNNIASNCGGGIAYIRNLDADVAQNIINCTFVDNQAHDGGGIYGFYSNLKITNCTIFRNSSVAKKEGSSTYNSPGGGISVDTSKGLTIQNCILWDNDAPTSDHKNLFEDYSSVEFPTKLDNCIIRNINEEIVSNEYYETVTDKIISNDPLLQPLANNGGFVPTCAVAAGSSAIGVGKVVSGLTTDARGITRSKTSPTIGAYEYVD